MPVKLTNAEITAFIAKGHKVTQGKTVGEALAGIAAKLDKPKGIVNRNAMQDRRKYAPYRSKAEQDYADYLQAAKERGEILDWTYESFGIKLPDWGFFYPDFYVVCHEGRKEFHEVKGRGKYAVTDKGKAKYLDAQRLRPEFTWRMIQRTDDGWQQIL